MVCSDSEISFVSWPVDIQLSGNAHPLGSYIHDCITTISITDHCGCMRDIHLSLGQTNTIGRTVTTGRTADLVHLSIWFSGSFLCCCYLFLGVFTSQVEWLTYFGLKSQLIFWWTLHRCHSMHVCMQLWLILAFNIQTYAYWMGKDTTWIECTKIHDYCSLLHLLWHSVRFIHIYIYCDSVVCPAKSLC